MPGPAKTTIRKFRPLLNYWDQAIPINIEDAVIQETHLPKVIVAAMLLVIRPLCGGGVWLWFGSQNESSMSGSSESDMFERIERIDVAS